MERITSERQVEANRRNAQRSTGPKTEEGKRKSRQNGLKHGLTAEVVVPEEELEAFERVYVEYRSEILPGGLVENELTRRVAVNSVRMRRCEQAEQDALVSQVTKAVADWRQRKMKSVRGLAKSLKSKPAETIERLEETAFGCAWMIRQWEKLERRLKRAPLSWSESERLHALRLMGYDPNDPSDRCERHFQFLSLCAHQLNPDEIPAPASNDAATAEVEAKSRQLLLALVAEQLERLEDLCEDAWERVDGPERKGIESQARIDTSPSGMNRHRYERSAELNFHRSINQLVKLKDRQIREDFKAVKAMVPKRAMGGGWWKEDNASAAPPGFIPEPPRPFARSEPIVPTAEGSENQRNSSDSSTLQTGTGGASEPGAERGDRGSRGVRETPLASGPQTEPEPCSWSEAAHPV